MRPIRLGAGGRHDPLEGAQQRLEPVRSPMQLLAD
jgi:hypothetical protein